MAFEEPWCNAPPSVKMSIIRNCVDLQHGRGISL